MSIFDNGPIRIIKEYKTPFNYFELWVGGNSAILIKEKKDIKTLKQAISEFDRLVKRKLLPNSERNMYITYRLAKAGW